MRPLTHQVWEQHFAELRPHVLEQFPGVDRPELQRIEDDWDGLVALVQRATGMSADLTRLEIQKMDVEELGLGAGREGEPEGGAGLDQLSLGTGFQAAERDRVVERLRQLGRRLKRFRADGTWLELSVKDRDATSQVVTLETEVPGFSRFVAKSKEPDLAAALAEVRDGTIAQLESAVGKRSGGS